MVLVTAVVATNERNVDFFPLTVDVEAGMYAAGKIPGGFIKKEGRASDHSILNARLIDRPIRPLWPKGFNRRPTSSRRCSPSTRRTRTTCWP